MVRIVVLGAGRSGTLVANRLCERASRARAREVIVTVIDRDDARVHRDRLFVVPFGVCRGADAVTPRGAALHPDANYIWSGIDRIDVEGRAVVLGPGTRMPYDVLVVATGSRARPDLTPGLMGCGWRKRTFELGTLDGAMALRRAFDELTRGRLVIDAVEQPVRRPLNLLRFALLARSYFAQRGLGGRVEIAFAAPLAGAFETRHASLAFVRMLAERGVAIEPDFRTASVDGELGILRSASGRDLRFDLLATMPVRSGAAFVERSHRLGDGRGFVRCDARTRHALEAANVFAVGEARSAGGAADEVSAAVESRIVAENVWRILNGGQLIRGLEDLSVAREGVERAVPLAHATGERRVEGVTASVGAAPELAAAGVPAAAANDTGRAMRPGPYPQTWTMRVPVGQGTSAPSERVRRERPAV